MLPFEINIFDHVNIREVISRDSIDRIKSDIRGLGIEASIVGNGNCIIEIFFGSQEDLNLFKLTCKIRPFQWNNNLYEYVA